MNNNRLHGPLPEVVAPQLVVLALHKNELTGVLPKSLHLLKKLGVLTLHENSMSGSINDLNLTVPCMDNARFQRGGMGCEQVKALRLVAPRYVPMNFDEFLSNCPTLSGCSDQGVANLTLHRNRFSCAVPERVSRVNLTGLVIIGNMLGFGSELNSTWILPEEKQSFLYYSDEVWKTNLYLLSAFLMLLFFAVLCRPQRRRRLQQTSRNLDFVGTARVASSNFALPRDRDVRHRRVMYQLPP